MILELRGKSGEKQAAIGVPVKLSATPGSIRSEAVDFGKSTAPILKELGYSQDQITELTKKDVI